MTKPLGALGAVLCLALPLAACGEKTLEQGSIEDNVRETYKQLGASAPKEVSCPDDVSATKGTTFECQSTAADGKTKVTVKWRNTNDDGAAQITNQAEVAGKIVAAEAGAS